MKARIVITLIFFSFFGFGQMIKIAKINDLQERIYNNSDTVYVVNFWATWCRPCVKELPDFEKLNQSFANKKIKLLLISIDFKKDYPKLKSFVQTKNIKSEVWLLDEPKYQEWIDKVDPTWNASIPATLVMQNKNGIRFFYEKSLTFDQLQSIINPLLNNP